MGIQYVYIIISGTQKIPTNICLGNPMRGFGRLGIDGIIIIIIIIIITTTTTTTTTTMKIGP
jgi:hypothetical protein